MSLHRNTGRGPLLAFALLLGLGAWNCASAEGAAGSAKKPARSACDRAAFRVAVDVGHTAKVPGAISARGFYEYDFNLRLATLVEHKLRDAGFAKTILLVTDGPARKSLFDRVARANASAADLFLSIHHDSVPDSFLQDWEYEGQTRHFDDRFKGHSIFFSIDTADPEGSLEFGRLLGEQLKGRGLQYTPHYVERFMGHRQRLLVDANVGVYRYEAGFNVGLGFDGITEVRQGKRFELELEGEVTADVLAEVEKVAETLLSNPVIENYTVTVE